jgi:tellurite resistance protein TehA-like permease
MWTYLFSFLLFRRLRIGKPIRYALAMFLIGLILAVLIYTAILFFQPCGKDESNPCLRAKLQLQRH